ncbi:matrixin family metalloprotease [Nonomuraea sp. NPDC049141]|uniref:matrixin family metalloprotease n=1 Tax=Nonomuraea sp. NPDC049141 TaxID=3155500 RepID=UPI0033F77BED
MSYRTLLPALALAAAVTMTAAPAVANGFGSGNGCCPFADNSKHWYTSETLETRTKSAAKAAMLKLDSQTDMTVAYDSTPDPSTDVEAFDRYYVDYWDLDWDGSSTGYNLFAYSKCVKSIPPADSTQAWRCDQYEVRYDLKDIDWMSTTQRQALACHEIGHTIGLDHSTESGSCLRTGSHTVTKYGTHDVAHINGRY